MSGPTCESLLLRQSLDEKDERPPIKDDLWVSCFLGTFLKKLGQFNSAPSTAFSPGKHDFGVGIITRWMWVWITLQKSSSYWHKTVGEKMRRIGILHNCQNILLQLIGTIYHNPDCVVEEGDEHLQMVTHQKGVPTGNKSRPLGVLVSCWHAKHLAA